MTEVLATGIQMGESPRWHDGRLWMCDWVAGEVLAFDATARREVVGASRACRSPSTGCPTDGGRDDGGRRPRRARSWSRTAASGRPWNEIVVDAAGRVYVNMPWLDAVARSRDPASPPSSSPTGETRDVAGDVWFPNGMAVTDDGWTLIVAESHAARLTAFTITADGTLTDRRVWADLGEGAAPDGICVDAEGAIWYADVPTSTADASPRAARCWRPSRSARGASRACSVGGRSDAVRRRQRLRRPRGEQRAGAHPARHRGGRRLVVGRSTRRAATALSTRAARAAPVRAVTTSSTTAYCSVRVRASKAARASGIGIESVPQLVGQVVGHREVGLGDVRRVPATVRRAASTSAIPGARIRPAAVSSADLAHVDLRPAAARPSGDVLLEVPLVVEATSLPGDPAPAQPDVDGLVAGHRRDAGRRLGQLEPDARPGSAWCSASQASNSSASTKGTISSMTIRNCNQ